MDPDRAHRLFVTPFLCYSCGTHRHSRSFVTLCIVFTCTLPVFLVLVFDLPLPFSPGSSSLVPSEVPSPYARPGSQRTEVVPSSVVVLGRCTRCLYSYGRPMTPRGRLLFTLCPDLLSPQSGATHPDYVSHLVLVTFLQSPPEC